MRVNIAACAEATLSVLRLLHVRAGWRGLTVLGCEVPVIWVSLCQSRLIWQECEDSRLGLCNGVTSFLKSWGFNLLFVDKPALQLSSGFWYRLAAVQLCQV